MLFAVNSHQRKAGFLNETVSQLELSFEFGYINKETLETIEESAKLINRMLWKLSKSLQKSEDRSSSVQRLFALSSVS
ncbi:four helix bundle protein [Mesotoga sp. H07.pep.5.3]|uniref:four helix bundle protein n=1 Tax=Mesotoga sp. H07.pep.5.3 TaxID=1421003 RepID=UPI00211E1088|nr:four helix bundle protein [Mesotoga sp. H07.pep.5.3]